MKDGDKRQPAALIQPNVQSGAALGVWSIAAASAALHLALAGRYDVFRNELYFIVCGRHPDFGYVDQPPLVPLLAAATQLIGDNIWMLRLPSVIAAAALPLVTAALARLLGGGAISAVLAAAAAALAPALDAAPAARFSYGVTAKHAALKLRQFRVIDFKLLQGRAPTLGVILPPDARTLDGTTERGGSERDGAVMDMPRVNQPSTATAATMASKARSMSLRFPCLGSGHQGLPRPQPMGTFQISLGQFSDKRPVGIEQARHLRQRPAVG